MPDLLWWVQVLGAIGGLFITTGTVLTAIWAWARGVPRWIWRLLGYEDMDRNVARIDRNLGELTETYRMTQHLSLQQAEAFNHLKETVCDYHDIPQSERPPDMDTELIREEILDRRELDFTEYENEAD